MRNLRYAALPFLMLMLGLMPAAGQAQSPHLAILLPEEVYQPGVYDSGPIPVPAGGAALQHTVCALSGDAAVDITGEVMYTTDEGTTWLEWAPFGMSLGEPTWDNKRNQWLPTPDSCSGTSISDTSGWTHVRLFLSLTNAPAVLSATLDAPVVPDPELPL